MANTATVKVATPVRLSYELVGDGTVAGPTIANATILAALPNGPLKDAWNATYADQAAMRNALLYGVGALSCEVRSTLVATGVDVTAEKNQVVVDVDTDAVTATKAEINFGMSDTTGQRALVVFEYKPQAVR